MVKEIHHQSRAKEIGGVILMALSIFFLLCLVSYQPTDPSFTHYVAGKAHIENLGGFIGSYTSDSLIKLLGISSYLIPLFFIVISFQLLLNKSFSITPVSCIGFIALVFSTATLTAGILKTITLFGVKVSSGGLLGSLSADVLFTYLNHIGTYIVLSVIFIVSLMITVDLSLVATTRGTLSIFRSIIRIVKTFLLIRIEQFKRKKKLSKEKKAARAKDIPIIKDDPPLKKEAKPPKKVIEQLPFEFIQAKETYTLPPLNLLDNVERKDTKVKRESLIMNSRLLEKKLADFGVDGRVTEVKPGPLIAMYELEPAPGVKINRITNLSDDLALALKAQSIRIIAPIPGKAAIGIEIPNHEREVVHLKEVIDNSMFLDQKLKLPIALGVDIVGKPEIADLVKMPHLLIAGTTGSGKSVSLNAMICSIMFKATPHEVKFLMIDPKRLELSAYEGIPHLIHPVVVNPKKAAQVLKWAVEEMERRYKIIAESGVKSIEKYNRYVEKLLADQEKVPPMTGRRKPQEEEPTHGDDPGLPASGEPAVPERLPYIVIIIDELADLMMVAQRHVEESLARLAQMARAAGIHLILATQRPSVDVITGIIKANFPTRISFQVSSKVDSRTILDALGAEKLLGSGDMLFVPPGTSRLTRIHGPYVSDSEIDRIVTFVKKQASPDYDDSIADYKPDLKEGAREEEFDEKYDEAVALVTDLGQASISLVQRYMKIGYNRAARIIERMEAEGIVGPSDGVKPRTVLARKVPE
ncbi:MAG: DNA translocase FtsK 4TM domain-containing protein [Deltaproteobacteria bacterium]|nr:DNA translocase FtsK 4TM domain-containing protein [Deltaproteobacteria bacterium]